MKTNHNVKTIDGITYVKITKLANDLGVTKATLYNWNKIGLLQFIKPSNLQINFVTEETYTRLVQEKQEYKKLKIEKLSKILQKLQNN